MPKDHTITIRIPSDLKEKLDLLAQETGRSKSYLAAEALRSYVELEAWQVSEIQKGIEEADAGDFVSEEEVERVFSKYK